MNIENIDDQVRLQVWYQVEDQVRDHIHQNVENAITDQIQAKTMAHHSETVALGVYAKVWTTLTTAGLLNLQIGRGPDIPWENR
jgi:hypothetical protein